VALPPSPNMGLVLPVVGSDKSQWGQLLDEALTRIDAHTHADGNGVQVPTAGLDIDDSLDFGGNDATNVGSIAFGTGTITITDGVLTVNGVPVGAGSGGTTLDFPGQTHGDLVCRDSSEWTRLPAGTPGQVLSTNGAGQNPTWITAVSNQGSMVNLADFASATTMTANAIDGLPFEDWRLAWAAALAARRANDFGGIFIPSRAAPYLVSRDTPGTIPSIDIRGVDGDNNFQIVGEGPKSCIKMWGSGQNGAWYLFWLRLGAENIWFHDFCIDGAEGESGFGNVEEQTHTVRVGSTNTAGSINEGFGYCRNIAFTNMTITRSHGAGLFLVGARTFADGDDVSGILISNNALLNNHRSCIDGQRTTRFVRVIGNHFDGGTNSSDQLLDFEGTGSTAESASYWTVVGNTFRHTNNAICVTLGGINDINPSKGLTFANNHVLGGNVLVTDVVGLVFANNVIEGGASANTSTLDFNSRCEHVYLHNNRLTRPTTASGAQVVHADATSESGRPRHWHVSNNTFVQGTDSPIVLLESGDDISWHHNKHFFANPSTTKPGISYNQITSSGVALNFSDNEFYGATGSGSLTVGLRFSATGDDIHQIRASNNTFNGCVTHIQFTSVSGVADIVGRPDCTGNTGGGADFLGLDKVEALCVGGNQGVGGIADYVYAGNHGPRFFAPDGSTARRREGADIGTTIYQRQAGQWGETDLPATAADFTNRGIAAPASLWLCQESSGNLADSIGGVTLTANASPLYETVIPGRAQKAVTFNETALQRFMVAGGTYNPNSTSVAALVWVRLRVATSAVRLFLVLGSTSGTPLWVGLNVDGTLRLNCADVLTTGTVDHRTGFLLPVLFKYNRSGATVQVITHLETITGTYAGTVTDGLKGLGANTGTPPDCDIPRLAWWTGASAEGLSLATLNSLGWF